MDRMRVLLSRCTGLFGSRRLDADLDEESGARIDLAIEGNRGRRMNEQEARTAALRAFVSGMIAWPIARRRFAADRFSAALQSFLAY
jgi:hypothetical protein